MPQVQDALGYLEKVKNRFANEPNVYNNFLDIMKDFKSQAIDTDGVIARVKSLFKGNKSLILGFNQFLPPGYKIEMDPVPPPPPQQPAKNVEFNHAVNYVAKIKQRFHDRLEIYGEFLEILHDYQAKRTIEEVYARVQRLFVDHPDLLDEFQYFLPDSQGNIPFAAVAPSKKMKKGGLRGKAMREKGLRGDRDRDEMMAAKPEKPPKMRMVTYPAGSQGDLQMFDRIKQTISKNQWTQLIRVLNLWTVGVINRPELVRAVDDCLGPHVSEFGEKFRAIIGFDDFEERQAGMLANQPRSSYYSFISNVDFSACPLVTSSYRQLPENVAVPTSSARTTLSDEVLNDYLVSLPTGSEDYSFKSSRKNIYEENLFKMEDERYELDMLIENNAAAIRVLEPLVQKLAGMSPEQARRQRLNRNMDILHVRAIARIYGEQGYEMAEMLKHNPAAAGPVVLARLKQKDAEWRRVRLEMKSQWRRVFDQNYARSLDHRSFYFKQEDKKKRSAKALVTELRELQSRVGQPKEQRDADSLTQEVEPLYNYAMHVKYPEQDTHQQVMELVMRVAERQMSEEEQVKLYMFLSGFVCHFFRTPSLPLPAHLHSRVRQLAAKQMLNANGTGAGSGSSGKTENGLGLLRDEGEEGEEVEEEHEEENGAAMVEDEEMEPALQLQDEEDERERERERDEDDEDDDGVKRRRARLMEDEEVEVDKEMRGTRGGRGRGRGRTRGGGVGRGGVNAGRQAALLGRTAGRSYDDNDEGEIADAMPESKTAAVGPRVSTFPVLAVFSSWPFGSFAPLAGMTPELHFAPNGHGGASVQDASGTTTPLLLPRFAPSSFALDEKLQPMRQTSRPSHLLMCSTPFYVFFRLHHMLYDRLHSAKMLALKSKKNTGGGGGSGGSSKRRQPTTPEERYARFREYLTLLLDGDMENSKFEDELRALLGASSYQLFTIDKLISQMLKQTQAIFNSSSCLKQLLLYQLEYVRAQQNGAMTEEQNAQWARMYWHNGVSLVADEPCMQIEYFLDTQDLAIELVEALPSREARKGDTKEWRTYMGRLLNAPSRVRLSKQAAKPFLPRNIRRFRSGAVSASSPIANTPLASALGDVFMHNGLEIKINSRNLKSVYADGFDCFYRRRQRAAVDKIKSEVASGQRSADDVSKPLQQRRSKLSALYRKQADTLNDWRTARMNALFPGQIFHDPFSEAALNSLSMAPMAADPMTDPQMTLLNMRMNTTTNAPAALSANTPNTFSTLSVSPAPGTHSTNAALSSASVSPSPSSSTTMSAGATASNANMLLNSHVHSHAHSPAPVNALNNNLLMASGANLSSNLANANLNVNSMNLPMSNSLMMDDASLRMLMQQQQQAPHGQLDASNLNLLQQQQQQQQQQQLAQNRLGMGGMVGGLNMGMGMGMGMNMGLGMHNQQQMPFAGTGAETGAALRSNNAPGMMHPGQHFNQNMGGPGRSM